jgi:hypothetical protein
MRRGTVTALAIALALAGGAYLAGRLVPPRFSPLAPLDVRDEPVPLATAMKLARARTDLAYCRAALATSALQATAVPQMSSPRGCELHDVERIAIGRDPAFSSSFIATCALAVDVALFVRHVVVPAAARDIGSAVVTIDHLGSFACRPIAGAGSATEMSQHAGANAIDIAGFVFANGEQATVAHDWRGDDAKARVIHDVHDDACRIFPVVLSPDFNAAHQSHLHLDLSGFHFCR